MSRELVIAVVAALAAGIAVLAVRAWRLGAENYDRLPDRIPTHFNLSGKPDAWARKSRLSVFWAPVTLAIIGVFMSGIFLMLYRDEGPEAGPVAVCGMLLTLSVCWTMYAAQQGIISAALGKEEKIWRFMTRPLLLLVLVSVAFTAWPFVAMREPATFQKAVFCRSVDARSNPVGPGESFSAGDRYVYVLATWKNLNGEADLAYNWYAPSGKKIHEGVIRKKYKKMRFTRNTWYRLDLQYYRERGVDLYGDWAVEISDHGRQVWRGTFRVE